MNVEIINIIDLLLTNGLIIWLALRMVKRVDNIDEKVDSHETRITVIESKDKHNYYVDHKNFVPYQLQCLFFH